MTFARDSASLGIYFDHLTPEQLARTEAVVTDMSPLISAHAKNCPMGETKWSLPATT